MEPVQIVESDSKSRNITFNEEALRAILTRDEIRNRYVSVISICGAARQGKSFILNFFLRYLNIKYIENKDVTGWLSPDDGPIKGFQWASGSKRHTMGIQMWPEVFLTTLNSGEEVAIILLDTQGAFDNHSSMDACARIFALSTLISSTQIYNVMRGIKQYDFSHLQCFGGYSRLMTGSRSAAFQNLHFLVRDWASRHEHNFGSSGGLAYLEDNFSSEEPEVREQVEIIKNLFEKIECSLLPYPGSVVDTARTFDGDLNAIDIEFREAVRDFTELLLSPENLTLKTINGEKVKAKDLMLYVESYSKILEGDELPTVQTYFQATVEVQLHTAYRKAVDLFKELMDADINNSRQYLDEEQLYYTFFNNKKQGVDSFTLSKTLSDEATFDKFLVQLKNEMDGEYKTYVKLNANRRQEFERRRELEEAERKDLEKRSRIEAEKRAANEEKRRRRMEAEKRDEKERVERRRQQLKKLSENPGTGNTSGLAQAGTSVAVVGVVAAVAFGLAKVFGGSRNNNN